METLYEGSVEPGDIDNLGHMNVRVYARKAAAATHELAARLGLDKPTLARIGGAIEIFDQHVRFYREQMEGNSLVAKGGVITATPESITAYIELMNAETGDLAATFSNGFRLVDAKTRQVQAMDLGIVGAAEGKLVDWPDYGRPRSIPLEPVRTDITLQQMGEEQVMVRLEPYTIAAEDCEENGFMDISDGTSLAFAKLPIKFERQKGESNGWGDNVAIATMESRHFLIENPRQGDTIVTRSTHINVGRKTLHSVHWSFNERTGKPVAMVTQIGLCFDLIKRRSREFPPEMREKLEENVHKELA